METKTIYTLSAILKRIRVILEEKFTGKQFWLLVEIANINFHSSGHCYLELSENHNGVNIAQCKGSIWQTDLKNISHRLGDDFKNVLKKGNEIQCYVELKFTEKYGLNIIIKEIDYSFNLGKLEKKKQETINQLKSEGLLEKNKHIVLPMVLQRIAIIGSPDTAGFTDLVETLNNNTYHFRFEITTFACSVQGERAEAEIITRLKTLSSSKFDVIALVRGGGSKLDLEVFNSYLIAKEIACLNKPVFTGIGHETDISVVDLVANQYHKTPSALGAYIVDRAYNFYVRITTSYTSILEFKKRYMDDKWSKLKINLTDLNSTAMSYTRLRRGNLHQSINRLNTEANRHINSQKNLLSLAVDSIRVKPAANLLYSKSTLLHTLEIIQVNSTSRIRQALSDFGSKLDLIFNYSKKSCEEKAKNISNISLILPSYHPESILNKGYSIPRFNGGLLTSQQLKPNDQIELELFKRIILVSFIKNIQKWKT